MAIRILCAVRHYLPGYRSGGPVRSIANLAEALGDTVDLRITCLDRDLGQHAPYADLARRQWQRVGRSHVMYLAPADVSARTWRRIVQEIAPDLLYVNSLFDMGFSLAPMVSAARAGVPVVIAPRGELSAGALALKAPKKRAFLLLARVAPPYARAVWHACSNVEADDIRRAMRRPVDVRVAANLPSSSQGMGTTSTKKEAGTLRVMFLSRIVRKKNLLAAIRMVAAASGRIWLDIWGPVEDERYATECRHAAADIPATVRVVWRGELPHEHVRAQMLHYDVLLFPTLGENFGHVVYEALSCGLPVLTSDRTPWRDLQRCGVGADLPLTDESAFVRELRRLRDLDNHSYGEIRAACAAFAQDWRLRHTGAQAYRDMFEGVIRAGSRDVMTVIRPR